MKTERCEIRNAYSIRIKRYEPDGEPAGYVLALHGFCGDMESSFIRKLGKVMTEHELSVVAFNFPGHGSSDADSYFSLENCRRDMLDVMKYSNRRYGVSAPYAVVGTSFGGYVALLDSGDIPDTTKIVLRAPAVNMKRSFESFVSDMKSFRRNGWEEMGFERKIAVPFSFYSELEKYSVLEHCFDREMLIVHGDSDTVVLPEEMKTFGKNNPLAELRVIVGADHRFKGEGQLKCVFDIIDEYMFSRGE